MSENAPTAQGALPERRPAWAAFAMVTVAYLAVTVGESILPPLFPVVADELGLDLRLAGFAFGLLTGMVAVGNFAGGYVLARAGARAGIAASLVVTGVGTTLAAVAGGRDAFLWAQALIGLGSGIFFAPGVDAAGVLAGPRRRGLAMGIFGVAFSGGLAVAALLAAAGASASWRIAFWVATAACAAAFVAMLWAALPPRRREPVGGTRKRLREALGVAVVVGGVGAVSQYGTVSFLPAFAVAAWRFSPAAAAVLLAVGRILSVPAKLLAGAAADRWGSHVTVWGLSTTLVATGLLWTVAPPGLVATAAAAVFAATVSALFPIANLLAIEGFGGRGPLLGTYRSVQIGVGALGAYVIGLASDAAGLRPTLAVAVLLPGGLLLLRRTAARERGAAVER